MHMQQVSWGADMDLRVIKAYYLREGLTMSHQMDLFNYCIGQHEYLGLRLLEVLFSSLDSLALFAEFFMASRLNISCDPRLSF